MRISDWSSDVCSSDLGFPVVIDLLVRAARHAHAPAAAGFLIDQDDAIFLALVDRAGWAGGDASRVEAMFAQPGEIHHEGVFELARSEEHTSELQSLMRISYAVFCLKKKIKSTRSK